MDDIMLVVASVCTFISIVLIALFNFLYTPVPAPIEEKWKYRVLFAVGRILDALSVGLAKKNGEPCIVNLRFLLKKIKGKRKPPEDDPNVRCTMPEFGGVPVRLYEPKKISPPEKLPALIYIHGGGFCLGDTEEFDALTRELCERLGAVVVSIEYRLAPEHKFPAAYEDCFNSTVWFLRHLEQFRVDPTRLSVLGVSAGGNLAAGLVQRLRTEIDLPKLKSQFLVYPMTQMLDQNTPANQRYKKIFGVHRGLISHHNIATSISNYLYGFPIIIFQKRFPINEHISTDFQTQKCKIWEFIDHKLVPASMKVASFYKEPAAQFGDKLLWNKVKDRLLDPRVSPLLAENLSGLPHAYIITCEYDGMRDDGLMYAKRLEHAGVHVSHMHYQKGFHGILTMPFKLGESMKEDIIKIFKADL